MSLQFISMHNKTTTHVKQRVSPLTDELWPVGERDGGSEELPLRDFFWIPTVNVSSPCSDSLLFDPAEAWRKYIEEKIMSILVVIFPHM